MRKAAFIRWCEGHVVSTSVISTLVIMALLFMGVLSGCSVRVEPRQEADALKAEVVMGEKLRADAVRDESPAKLRDDAATNESPAKPGFTRIETEVSGLVVIRDDETGCEYLATQIGGYVGGLSSLQPRRPCA